MKARSIENLLKYNQIVKAQHEEIGNLGLDYTIASTWVDAISYVVDNYECTPKENK
mgnify:CR=1 FL=1